MSETLEINGKKLLPIKEVVKEVSYSKDYITRLAREEKIFATHVGRNWFVDLDSVKNYENFSKAELEIRKKQLSKERKMEKKMAEAVVQKKQDRKKQSRKIKLKAVSVAMMVLGVGLLTGWSTYSVWIGEYALDNKIVQVDKNQNNFSDYEKFPIAKDTALVSFSDTTETVVFEDDESTMNIRLISGEVENGILLLPQGGISASATQMFSDKVAVLTSEDGNKVVVRLDKEGRPTGNVIPFVSVPVNHLEI